MKELKFDPKLQTLFKPLTEDKLNELKQKLLIQYDGTPLYVWKKNIIVDGHNRYPILKEYNIDFLTKDVEDFLGQDCTRADVMQWMISHQQARRNLSAGELIFANSMVADEIALENKKKISNAVSESNKNRALKLNCVQVDANETKTRDRSTNTREQVAKLSGVGVGTVARYDAVMKSDDEELKRKVQTGEVKIGTAYKEVKKREYRTCKRCGIEKKLIDFFGDDAICKECSRKESEININAQKSSSSKPSSDMTDIYKDVLTARNAKDQINQEYEISWLKDKCNDFISQVNDKFFDLLAVIEKMDREHISEAYDIFEDFVSEVFEIQEKFNNKKEI